MVRRYDVTSRSNVRYVVTENKKIDQLVDKWQLALSSVSVLCRLDWQLELSEIQSAIT